MTCILAGLMPYVSAADKVARLGRGKDLGHSTVSVGNRGLRLRRPKTPADGEARHGEQPKPLRARANTRLMLAGTASRHWVGRRADQVDLRAHSPLVTAVGSLRQCPFGVGGRGGSIPCLARQAMVVQSS